MPLKRAGIIALSGILVAVLAACWLVASAFQSSAQREAAARPPAERPVTSEVVRGSLEETVSTRAAVGRRVHAALPIPGRAEYSVVTRTSVRPGEVVGAGTVVSEINGRPLIALPGVFPFYRDLRSGMSGPDVSQLQAALSAAGYPVATDGAFGAQTVRAVVRLYDAIGYETPTASAPAAPVDAASPTPDPAASPALTAAVVVPRSELLVVPTTPAFAVSLPTAGSQVTGDTRIELESGEVVAQAEISPATGARLKAGMAVMLDDGAGGSVQGQVDVVEAASGEQEAAGSAGPDDPPGTTQGDKTRLVVRGTDGAGVPAEWLRKTVLAVVTIRLVAGDALLVPSVAVAPSGNDHPRVQKQMPDGTFRSIGVKEIASLEGRAAIEPARQDELEAGDLVRVG